MATFHVCPVGEVCGLWVWTVYTSSLLWRLTVNGQPGERSDRASLWRFACDAGEVRRLKNTLCFSWLVLISGDLRRCQDEYGYWSPVVYFSICVVRNSLWSGYKKKMGHSVVLTAPALPSLNLLNVWLEVPTLKSVHVPDFNFRGHFFGGKRKTKKRVFFFCPFSDRRNICSRQPFKTRPPLCIQCQTHSTPWAFWAHSGDVWKCCWVLMSTATSSYLCHD